MLTESSSSGCSNMLQKRFGKQVLLARNVRSRACSARQCAIRNSFPGRAASQFRLRVSLMVREITANRRGDGEMSKENSVVAVYHTHTEADQAVKELQRGGVDLHKLSIVGKGYHTDEQVVGYYNTGDRMKYLAKLVRSGEAFGGFCSDLLSLLIPGLGPILVAGPVVAWIVAGLEGAVEVGALGALGAGLYSIGIPKDSIVKYETALKTDQFLLIAHGTAAEVAKAKDIIEI